MSQHIPSRPIPHWEKDERKLNKIIELCKQLGVEYCINENAKYFENMVVIKVPYKKVFLCELGVAGNYKED